MQTFGHAVCYSVQVYLSGLLDTEAVHSAWQRQTAAVADVIVKMCGQLHGSKSQEISGNDSIRHGRPQAFHIVGVISPSRMPYRKQGAWVAYKMRSTAQLTEGRMKFHTSMLRQAWNKAKKMHAQTASYAPT